MSICAVPALLSFFLFSLFFFFVPARVTTGFEHEQMCGGFFQDRFMRTGQGEVSCILCFPSFSFFFLSSRKSDDQGHCFF